MYRVGIGYDIHRLMTGRKLFLGGVKIPYKKGLMGHSDADVLLHAIADALLGACALQDIGEHFPDTDKRYKDISSVNLLKEITRKIKKARYKIANVDAVILAQEPKLTKYKKKMGDVISKTLGISKRCVNIKATTTEGLGAIGEKKAISAYAVCLVKNDQYL